jgi:hypothetical protein
LELDIEPGSIQHLTQVISHVVAPAFLLGAVASFISILVARMNGVIDRIRSINDIPEEGHTKSGLKTDLPRLKRRAALLHRAMYLSISSGIVAALLIIMAFGAALMSFNHAWASAILFMISLGLLCASLVVFALEVKIGLNEHDHY